MPGCAQSPLQRPHRNRRAREGTGEGQYQEYAPHRYSPRLPTRRRIAIAAAGAFVSLDGDVVSDVGIGLTAVGAPHFCAPEAEDLLRGRPATEENLAAAAEAAAAGCSPSADQRGPADYKRHLAQELTLRALRRSVARVRGEG